MNSGSGGNGNLGGDAGATGGAGTGGNEPAPPSWCEEQTRPAEVDAADYSCLDFDEGFPEESEWSQVISDTGSLVLTGDAASSLPQAMLVSAGPNEDVLDKAFLSRNLLGVEEISRVTVSAALNPPTTGGVPPPWSGDMDILCVDLADNVGEACLSYDLGDYTGLTLNWIYAPSAAVSGFCELDIDLPKAEWTNVLLDFDVSEQQAIVTVGTEEPVTCDLASSGVAGGEVRVGLARGYQQTGDFSLRIDDVVVSVYR